MDILKLIDAFSDVLKKNAIVRFIVEVAVIWWIIDLILSKFIHLLGVKEGTSPVLALIIALALNIANYLFKKSKEKSEEEKNSR